MRAPGEPFHIPGEGNGYVMEIDPLRIYIAGDTELIPEMSGLEAIDIAFLPKDVPYTMNDSMFIEAARVIRPKILLPYHCPKPRIDRTMLRKRGKTAHAINARLQQINLCFKRAFARYR